MHGKPLTDDELQQFVENLHKQMLNQPLSPAFLLGFEGSSMTLTRTEIARAFQTLFQIWKDTENADVILQDACRTLGSAFGMRWDEIDRFEKQCRGQCHEPF